jgi:hypothetical protein
MNLRKWLGITLALGLVLALTPMNALAWRTQASRPQFNRGSMARQPMGRANGWHGQRPPMYQHRQQYRGNYGNYGRGFQHRGPMMGQRYNPRYGYGQAWNRGHSQYGYRGAQGHNYRYNPYNRGGQAYRGYNHYGNRQYQGAGYHGNQAYRGQGYGNRSYQGAGGRGWHQGSSGSQSDTTSSTGATTANYSGHRNYQQSGYRGGQSSGYQGGSSYRHQSGGTGTGTGTQGDTTTSTGSGQTSETQL